MGKTSTAVKRKYNDKTYTDFRAWLRNEDYSKLDKIITDRNISKAEFIRQAIKKFEEEIK